MAAASPGTSVSALQDLFYRCKFNALLEDLAKHEELTGSLDAEMTLIKANALFELHRVADAKACLRSISQKDNDFDENYLYALARVCYLDGDTASALRIFTEIHESTTSERHRFKGLLGAANALYTRGRYDELPAIAQKLTAFEPLDRDDERISLMLFLGNCHFAALKDYHLSRQYYKKALATAAGNTWTYFITRSLYGMAAVNEKDGQTNELMWTLELLQAFVNESEQLFFAYIVNDRFKTCFSINTPMEFDTANRRIMIKSTWVPFHDKPLLFQFLLLLHTRGNFVPKEELAQALWPNEEYKPRLHDPRIFDIAKRARQLIEAYENQPVVLLSGRMGYKLASM